jgi:ASC-1-like (ASCH) protein
MSSAIKGSSSHVPLVAFELKTPRNNPERMEIVFSVFQRLFSDAKNALRRIEEGDNRSCRILYESGKPRALVVYAKEPKELHGCKSLEVKVLELLDRLASPLVEPDSSRLFCLLQRVCDIAKEDKIPAVHVELDANKKLFKQFYMDRGFVLVKESRNEGGSLVLQKRLSEPLSPPAPLSVPVEQQRPVLKSAPSVTLPPRATDYRPVTLKEPYVSLIRSGEKTIEGRIRSGMFYGVKIGDRFRFFSHMGDVYCRVTQVKHYASFLEMLVKEGFKKCIPQVHSLEAAVGIYDKIPGYTERAKAAGVLALHLSVEPNPSLEPAPVEGNASRKRGREEPSDDLYRPLSLPRINR